MVASPEASGELRILMAARAFRGVADGLVSLILPVYLLALGYGPFEAGLLVTATLAGSALLTLLIGLHAHRASGRTLLMLASVLMLLTGLAFAFEQDFWPLLVVAFIGTLNPSSGDASVFLPLEHAQLARAVAQRDRTRVFAQYSFTGSIASACGALCAGLPELAVPLTGVLEKQALQAVFLLYAAVGAIVLLVYARLPRAVVVDLDGDAAQPLGRSRKIVLILAALFSLNSFAGGFVVQSLLALWLFERFGLSLAATGAIFFWAGVLSAISYFAAVWISERIGLIRTMVFTHLPANLCLILVAFAPTPLDCRYAVADSKRALANGRSDTRFLRHGRGDAVRTAGGRERHGSAAESRFGSCSHPGGVAPRELRLRLAIGHLRRAEDPLRSAAAGGVPEHSSARRGGPTDARCAAQKKA